MGFLTGDAGGIGNNPDVYLLAIGGGAGNNPEFICGACAICNGATGGGTVFISGTFIIGCVFILGSTIGAVFILGSTIGAVFILGSTSGAATFIVGTIFTGTIFTGTLCCNCGCGCLSNDIPGPPSNGDNPLASEYFCGGRPL